MSLTDIKTKNQGFTIVELLIVVVVIAILAAITIVSYNGITNRANQSASKSAASNVQKKAELYQADLGIYPTAAQLQGAGSDKAYAVPESVFTGSVSGSNLGTVAPTAENGKTKVQYATCGSPVTGAEVTYWNYGSKLQTSDGDTSTIVMGTGC